MDVLIKNMELPKERGLFLLIGCDGTVEQEVSKLGSFPVYNIVEGVKAIELPSHEDLISRASVLSLLRYYCDMREYKKDVRCEDCENRNACVVRPIMDEVNKLDTVLEAST